MNATIRNESGQVSGTRSIPGRDHRSNDLSWAGRVGVGRHQPGAWEGSGFMPPPVGGLVRPSARLARGAYRSGDRWIGRSGTCTGGHRSGGRRRPRGAPSRGRIPHAAEGARQPGEVARAIGPGDPDAVLRAFHPCERGIVEVEAPVDAGRAERGGQQFAAGKGHEGAEADAVVADARVTVEEQVENGRGPSGADGVGRPRVVGPRARVARGGAGAGPGTIVSGHRRRCPTEFGACRSRMGQTLTTGEHGMVVTNGGAWPGRSMPAPPSGAAG